MSSACPLVVVCTGANSGLGFEFCKRLVCSGPPAGASSVSLVMACRASAQATCARDDLLQMAVPGVQVDLVELDLTQFASVRRCAALLAVLFTRIDVLLLNAGVMFHRREHTVDGLDLTLQTNCYGHFLLTSLLRAQLDAAPAARVVSVSSVTHWLCDDVPLDDLRLVARTPDLVYKERVYCISKLLNLLFAAELQRRLTKANSRCISVACHPGWSKTMLMEHPASESWWFWLVFRIGNPLFAQSAERGAIPLWEAAFGADVHGGDYIGPDGCLFGLTGCNGVPVARSKLAHDATLAQRVFAVCEQITST
jgi:NAD(P)-dependent dehydrogenase (short-subunit alcohol dehydrogenase family)